ncbi:SurA N-terminal domain-containing protein [Actinocorallia longicatena]|uniref:Peptidyl-prolyl cis-trans isomerase SurA n=1 Tax=Actinocorallia longicatena TaxID=111803 RepID=A0ABP6Q1P0_9ACTN
MIKITVAVAAVALALTACGGPVQMGSAATLGDDRISDSTLNEAVSDWQDAYKANPLPAQDVHLADPASIRRSVLVGLVLFRVADQMADDNGITVTDAEIDQAIKANGGEAEVTRAALGQGVSPEHTRDFLKYVLVNQKIAAGSTSQEEADQKTAAARKKALGELDIKLNPRFGEMSDAGFGDVVTRLSRPETGTA